MQGIGRLFYNEFIAYPTFGKHSLLAGFKFQSPLLAKEML